MRVGHGWPVAGPSPRGGPDPRHRRRRAHRLRGCSLNQAFVEIVQTAKAHNVSTLSLADALVALTQNHRSQDGDDAALVAARHGATFSTRPGRAAAREVAAKTTVLAALRTG